MTQASRDRIKVLVVDDSAFSRQTIKKMLESDPDVEVVGIATDGIDAIAKTMRLKPDLITLDFEMPAMDGFSFLRWLMSKAPLPVIMVSSFSDSRTVFKALELGAVDFIAKPTRKASLELRAIEKDLLSKVKSARLMNLDVLSKNLKLLEKEEKPAVVDKQQASAYEIMAIGSSTGGPAALQFILTKLPSRFPCPVVVSQHMPKGFTGPLSERLNRLSRINIKEAQNGDIISPGNVYICPGGSHMVVNKAGGKLRVVLKESSIDDKYIPSVDVMMSSAAESARGSVLGVLLTGMGHDGRDGMLEIKAKGGYNIAESEETAVVFGMPQEAIKAGAANEVLPLTDIPGRIVKIAGTT